jgi:hypothetical protein
MLVHRLESAGAENRRRRLTQKNSDSRLGLLYLVLVCGNFYRMAHCRKAERGGKLPFSAVNEQSPKDCGPVRYSRLRPKAPAEALKAGQSRLFQDLRAMSMTKNERARAAIPHQDRRNLSCHAWFSSPRGTTMKNKIRREEMRTRRCSHGVARAIENLRGVRLPLVPRSNSRERLLPRL